MTDTQFLECRRHCRLDVQGVVRPIIDAPQAFASHANAALTPRAELRLALLVVDSDGTDVARRFMVRLRVVRNQRLRPNQPGHRGLTYSSARHSGRRATLKSRSNFSSFRR